MKNICCTNIFIFQRNFGKNLVLGVFIYEISILPNITLYVSTVITSNVILKSIYKKKNFLLKISKFTLSFICPTFLWSVF